VSRRITATSEELFTLLKAGPLFTSVTSPQPIIPQRIVCISVYFFATNLIQSEEDTLS
jgi:hypothetical protein